MARGAELTELTATELAAAIRGRAVSSAEVVSAFLGRIERLDPLLNAVVHLDADAAMRAARRVDRSSPGETTGRLRGVPVLLKDSHRVAGMPLIVGNPEAPRRPASSDGYVAARLRRDGAIILGKTNVARDLADFQTDNPVFGRTNNPWDPARTAGGSSGGAAAALAARMTPIEVGSDIAGSIRVPAHFCGVLGLMPTASLVSTRGHVTEPATRPRGGGIGALVSIGPMARDFRDLSLTLEVLAGTRAAVDGRMPPAGRIGIAPAFPGLRVEASVRGAVEAVGATAERAGAAVETAELGIDFAATQTAWVAVHEAARARGAGWRTIRSAARALAAVEEAWARAFDRYDAIVCPPAMCTAFTHRPTGTPIEVDGGPIPYWGLARYTTPFNLIGHPALVYPVTLDGRGLPIGVQVVGRRGEDERLLALGGWLASLGRPLPAPPLELQPQVGTNAPVIVRPGGT